MISESGQIIEALKRRNRILELKLIEARAETVLACAWGEAAQKATAEQEKAQAELDAMKLTREEKAL